MGQDTEVALRVFAIDYYLANTTAETTVFLNTSLSGNVTENIDVVQQALATISQIEDPEERMRSLNMISNEVNAIDSDLILASEADDVCTCSGRGVCDEDLEC